MSGFLAPVRLAGGGVVLEPLASAHVPALSAAVREGELWKLWYASVPAPEAMARYVGQALARQAEGDELPFVVRAGASGRIVGSTRYYAASAAHRHLSIGYTWYAASVQHSGLNTACKWLLLRHAFEALACLRVEFCTHWFNHRSRAAIERLGARQEGVLRNHRIMPDGSLRDSVVFSIIAAEWPAVRNNLLSKLKHPESS